MKTYTLKSIIIDKKKTKNENEIVAIEWIDWVNNINEKQKKQALLYV